MTPDSNPPSRTSMKNTNGLPRTAPAGAPPRPGGGGERLRAAVRRSSVHRSEVGADDVAIRADLLGRAVADLLAVVEDDDAVGDVHYDAHVVLDQDDRRAELLV